MGVEECDGENKATRELEIILNPWFNASYLPRNFFF